METFCNLSDPRLNRSSKEETLATNMMVQEMDQFCEGNKVRYYFKNFHLYINEELQKQFRYPKSLQNFPDLMISVVEFPIIDYLLRQDVMSRKVSSLQ